MELILTLLTLSLLPKMVLTQETTWVHICTSKTKEVSCLNGGIFEVTEIYGGYRESGCPDDFTGPITDITKCSRRVSHEPMFIQNIAKACNHANVCNVTALSTEIIFGCSQAGGVEVNFNSFSFTCTAVQGPSTASPSNRLEPQGQSTASNPTATSPGALAATEETPDYTSGQLAAVTISLFFLGLVLGAIGMLCFSVHRGIPDSLARCTRCRKRDDSTQGNALQRNTYGEERTDYYNVNTPDHGQNVGVQSGSGVSNGKEGVNAANITQDISLEDVTVYSELQNSDYVNGPDSALYDTLK